MANPAKRTQKSKPRKAAATAKPQRSAAATTKESTKSRTASAAPAKAKAGGKLSNVLHLMRRKEGATIVDLQEATGWQPHSVRAALTGFRKQGVEINRSKNGAGMTIYTAS